MLSRSVKGSVGTSPSRCANLAYKTRWEYAKTGRTLKVHLLAGLARFIYRLVASTLGCYKSLSTHLVVHDHFH